MAFGFFKREKPPVFKPRQLTEEPEHEGDLTKKYFEFLDKIEITELKETPQKKNERLISALRENYIDLKNPGLILLLWQDKNKREAEREENKYKPAEFN